jgi:RNA polymerase sigma factor (sigma-70 family)
MDIDDCVSEVITRALEGIRKGAQPQALIPWIMGIARHVVVEIYKNANHRGNSELSDLPEDYNPVENFVGSLVTQLDLQRVLEWVTQLPERQRKVISMVLEDYAPAEIAEYLGIRPSHVWREIYRARTAMRNARLPSNQRDAPPPHHRFDQLQFHHAIQQLPTRQRQVLTLNKQLGLTPTQIAAALSITPNTARVNLYHARRKIAARLQCHIDTLKPSKMMAPPVV